MRRLDSSTAATGRNRLHGRSRPTQPPEFTWRSSSGRTRTAPAKSSLSSRTTKTDDSPLAGMVDPAFGALKEKPGRLGGSKGGGPADSSAGPVVLEDYWQLFAASAASICARR